MKRSTSRILTTHTGSLPRPPGLRDLLLSRDERREVNPGAFNEGVREAVAEVVKKQTDIGLDVINDGEQGRAQYATYVKDRLTGFEGERFIRSRQRLDDMDFPDYANQRSQSSSTTIPNRPAPAP